MTCKDCLHLHVCKNLLETLQIVMNENSEKMENRCKGFEKRGNWICLPTDIGKLVYAIAEPCESCRHYDELPTEENVEACRKCRKCKAICVNFDYDLIPEWGKTVFATKKEAENALVKMRTALDSSDYE